MGWLAQLVMRMSGREPAGRAVDAWTRVDSCLRDEVLPALASVRQRLADEGYDPVLEQGEDWAGLAVTNFNGLPLEYRVTAHVYKEAVVNLASITGSDADTLRHYGRIEIVAGGRRREYDPARCTRKAIERGAIKYYRRFLMDTPYG